MYVFGYFFQKGHFKGSSKKRAHRQKTSFLGGGADDPPAPENLNCNSKLNCKYSSELQLLWKSMGWFLYDMDFRHERVNCVQSRAWDRQKKLPTMEKPG